MHLAPVVAIHAVQAMHGAVDFDDVARARGAVQAVDVLRQHAHQRLFLLERGDQAVSGVGLGAAAVRLDLGDVAPGDVGPGRHHLARQRLLDAQSVVGEAVVVEAADAAVGGQAGIDRDAGAGHEQDALRAREDGGDRIERLRLFGRRGLRLHLGHCALTSTRQS